MHDARIQKTWSRDTQRGHCPLHPQMVAYLGKPLAFFRPLHGSPGGLRANWTEPRPRCPDSSASSPQPPHSFSFASTRAGVGSATTPARCCPTASSAWNSCKLPSRLTPSVFDQESSPGHQRPRPPLTSRLLGIQQQDRRPLQQSLGMPLQTPTWHTVSGYDSPRRSLAPRRTCSQPTIPVQPVRRPHLEHLDGQGHSGRPHLTPASPRRRRRSLACGSHLLHPQRHCSTSFASQFSDDTRSVPVRPSPRPFLRPRG